MVKHYRNITLLIVLFIFTLCFYIIKGAYFEGNGGWIDLINKNAIKGNYDEAMNEYNTAKTFSSQNKDNEQKGKKHLFKAFERTLAKNKNDDKLLKQELVNQIYGFSEKKIIIVADIGLSENFLVYIDKIQNTLIDEKNEDFEKYYNLSKVEMTSDLYNTYDSYLKKKYKININHKALSKVSNYFR